MREMKLLIPGSGRTSVLYDDDGMAACGYLQIHGTKSAGFTFRSLT